VLSDSEAVASVIASEAERAHGERVSGAALAAAMATRRRPPGVTASPKKQGSYRLVTTPTVRRQLTEKLPEAVALVAYEFISGPLLENQHGVGKELFALLPGSCSARRGTYRVIYHIDDEASVVMVLQSYSPQGRLQISL